MDDDDFTDRYQFFREAWQAADGDDRRIRARRRAGWLKRVTVCWWKHRTRRLADGMYVSHGCWACAGG